MTIDLLFTGLAHLVPDLEAAAAAYRALGFPIVGPHDGPTNTGIRTATWFTSGLEYIEAVGVVDRARAAAAYPDWAAMERVQRAGGGAGRFHLLAADVPALVEHLKARGVPVAGPVERSITRVTGATERYTTARVLAGHPWDPFFISYGVPPRERDALLPARDPPAGPWTVARLVVETPVPDAAAAWLSDLLGVAVSACGADDAEPDGQLVAVPGCPLVFRAGAADRIVEVVLEGADAPTGAVAGLRYRPATARQTPVS